MSFVRFAAAAAFLVPAAVAPAAAQQAETQTQNVDARGLSFKAPASWKVKPTTSAMRAAQLQAEPVKGDDFPADLVVYVFPGGAGTVDANVDRWKAQFKAADGSAVKAETRKVKAKGVEVTRVEIYGAYHPTAFPGMPAEPDRENARLLGAIVVTEKAGYYLKMVGPDKTMQDLSPKFNEMIATLEVSDK